MQHIGSFYVLVSLMMFLLSTQAFSIEPDVIYGKDNRTELFDNTNDPRMVRFAESTALLTFRKNIESDPNNPTQKILTGKTAGERLGLCERERFQNQPSRGYCSGSLVKDDVLLTAGHCIDEEHLCENMAVVFDFGYKSSSHDPVYVKAADVYFCEQVIKREEDPGSLGHDFALVKLDRKVQGRSPLEIRKSGSIGVRDNVTVIGHPMAIPTKIATGIVRQVETDFFDTNLDVFMGNSGSAVFNSKTGLIEGVLVSGEEDFEWIEEEQCSISKHCTDTGCLGENITPAKTFLPFLK